MKVEFQLRRTRNTFLNKAGHSCKEYAEHSLFNDCAKESIVQKLNDSLECDLAWLDRFGLGKPACRDYAQALEAHHNASDIFAQAAAKVNYIQ